MYISSDKLAKSHTKKSGHGKERETFRKKLKLLLLAAQNTSIRTNYIKAKIDKTYQNGKCRLWVDRGEIINFIISKYRKLAQKVYKTRHDWQRKVIHWELCKKFKFVPKNKCYMHKPKSVLENKRHKILWDFEMQTSRLILTRRPVLDIVNKNKNEERKKERERERERERENPPTSELCYSG